MHAGNIDISAFGGDSNFERKVEKPTSPTPEIQRPIPPQMNNTNMNQIQRPVMPAMSQNNINNSNIQQQVQRPAASNINQNQTQPVMPQRPLNNTNNYKFNPANFDLDSL